jgi:serine/threonine protein kinase
MSLFLIDTITHRYFHEPKTAYLILEYLPNGELFKSLGRGGKIVDELICRKYILDIASAVQFMHARHVYHRDIKPENILISEDNRLKLADFGWAVHSPPPLTTRFTMCGTPEYVSPEMVSGKGHDNGVDLWALGILIYELLIGRYVAY